MVVILVIMVDHPTLHLFCSPYHCCEDEDDHADFDDSEYGDWVDIQDDDNCHCKLATLSRRQKPGLAWQAISLNVACRATKFAILQ